LPAAITSASAGGAVWHAWPRTTTERPSQYRPNVVQGAMSHKGGGCGRAINWPKTALKRAAEAIREADRATASCSPAKRVKPQPEMKTICWRFCLPATSTPQRATEKNGAQPTHAAA